MEFRLKLDANKLSLFADVVGLVKIDGGFNADVNCSLD